MTGPFEQLSAAVRDCISGRRWAEAAALPLGSAERLERGRLFARYGREAEAEADFAAATTDPETALAAAVEQALLSLRRAGPAAAAGAAADEAMRDNSLSDRTRARALLLRGIAEHRMNRWQLALRALAEALSLADRCSDVATRIEVLRAIGVVHAWRGRHSQALLHLTLGLADAAMLADTAVLAELLGELGRVNLEMRRYAHALAFLRRQEALAGDLLDPRGRLRLRLAIAQALTGTAAYEEAAATAEPMIAEAEAAGFSYLAFVAAREMALAHLRSGRADEARAALARARRHVGPDPESYEALALAAVEAELAAATDAPHADAALARVVAAWAERDLVAPEIEARLIEAELLMRRGAAPAAERTLRIALARARTNSLQLLEEQVRDAMTRLDIGEGLTREAERAIADSFAEADDGYVLLEKLGSGRFGAVFRAFDLERGREVALKRMTGFDRYETAERQRLLDSARREFEAAARIVHPGIARVVALGETRDGTIYVVQDFISGPSLREVMESDRRPAPPVVTAMLRRIALALAALHRSGVVHRDLKPENVLCPASDRPVLVDLGIAALPGGRGTARSRGTEGYAAPEQWNQAEVDHRADLYALGVIGFEWMAGRRPDPPPSSRLGWRRKALGERDAADLAAACTVAELREVLIELLAPEPVRRPSSADDVAGRLAAIPGRPAASGGG